MKHLTKTCSLLSDNGILPLSMSNFFHNHAGEAFQLKLKETDVIYTFDQYLAMILPPDMKVVDEQVVRHAAIAHWSESAMVAVKHHAELDELLSEDVKYAGPEDTRPPLEVSGVEETALYYTRRLMEFAQASRYAQALLVINPASLRALVRQQRDEPHYLKVTNVGTKEHPKWRLVDVSKARLFTKTGTIYWPDGDDGTGRVSNTDLALRQEAMTEAGDDL